MVYDYVNKTELLIINQYFLEIYLFLFVSQEECGIFFGEFSI